MVYRTIPRTVKICALKLYNIARFTHREICDLFGFSQATFYRVLDHWHEYQDDIPSPTSASTQGHPQELDSDDVDCLIFAVRANPTYFLDELPRLLQTNSFISIHFTTIHRELERAGMSRKRLDAIASERISLFRVDRIRHLSQYEPEQMGFLGEVSYDSRVSTKWCCGSKENNSATAGTPLVCGRHLTGAGLLSLDGMVSTSVLEGSFRQEDFLQWLREDVMSLTSPYPGTLSVLIMQNTEIHHSAEIHELAEEYGVIIEYLPPCLADLNPIEQAFSKIKHFIRQNDDIFSPHAGLGILYNFDIVLGGVIAPDDARGYFRWSGWL